MSFHEPKPTRPWYCIDDLTDEYHDVALRKGNGDLRMLKALKIIRSILVIVAISAISLYALYLGADATVVAAFSLPSLAAYAGAEAADYAALVQGYYEAREAVQRPAESDDDNGD